jgi:hypothetical protein
MPRDNRQVLKFAQQAFAAANQFQTNNYAMSTSVQSTGALIGVPVASTATAGFWYRGNSASFNRAGFRTTNADQSLLTSTETSAILNDPATIGNTESFEGYVRFQYAAVGALNTSGVTNEVFVEAASDSGSGTAGTDWTAISASLPVSPITSYAVKTPTAFSAGVVSLTSHGLQNGAIVFFGVLTPTNFALFQPLFVVNATANTFGVTTVRGSAATDTTLSGGGTLTSSLHYSNNPASSGGPRIMTIPVTPSSKPWVRLVYRVVPTSATTVASGQALWIDQVGFVVGRDTAAVI